jgi:hypothetical protein
MLHAMRDAPLAPAHSTHDPCLRVLLFRLLFEL